MLKKSYRLRSTSDIQKVLKSGRFRHIGDLVMIKWLENKLPNDRITMVVSLKVNKKAVVRNRIRRVCMEAITKEWLERKADKHYDIVIVAKKITEVGLEEAKEKIIKTLNNLTK